MEIDHKVGLSIIRRLLGYAKEIDKSGVVDVDWLTGIIEKLPVIFCWWDAFMFCLEAGKYCRLICLVGKEERTPFELIFFGRDNRQHMMYVDNDERFPEYYDRFMEELNNLLLAAYGIHLRDIYKFDTQPRSFDVMKVGKVYHPGELIGIVDFYDNGKWVEFSLEQLKSMFDQLGSPPHMLRFYYVLNWLWFAALQGGKLQLELLRNANNLAEGIEDEISLGFRGMGELHGSMKLLLEGVSKYEFENVKFPGIKIGVKYNHLTNGLQEVFSESIPSKQFTYRLSDAEADIVRNTYEEIWEFYRRTHPRVKKRIRFDLFNCL